MAKMPQSGNKDEIDAKESPKVGVVDSQPNNESKTGRKG